MIPSHLPWAKSYPPSVDWAEPLPPRALYEILDDAIAAYPNNLFLDFLDKKYTYRQAGKLIARAAKGLQEIGVKKGDRVGLLLPNTPHFVILYFAILKVGGTVVNFNPLYAEREIEKQIRDAGVTVMAAIDIPSIFNTLEKARQQTSLRKVIVGSLAEVLPFFTGLVCRFKNRKSRAQAPRDGVHILFRDLLANDGQYTPVLIDPEEDIAVLQYTGGTTGVPKGAMLTHANLSINAVQSQFMFPGMVKGKERMMTVLPLYHVFAMTCAMNVPIVAGGAMIMLPRFDLGQLVKTIHRKKPTLMPAVPAIFTAINHYKSIGKYNLKSIRHCISGGAPLPVEVKREFERRTGCALVEGYGLSETSPVVSCGRTEGASKEGSIGLPLPGTLVEIVSMEDGQTVMPLGERGEVCVRGPQVMKGYWNQPEETENVLKEQLPALEMSHLSPGAASYRLHTGDVGVMDEDGYIYIVDRIKDMIAMGAFKVYPRHVEEVIYQHPAVEECVVAGIPSPTRVQIVKAFIKLRSGQSLTKAELTFFLQDKLSSIEMPRQVEFRDILPKTAVGKLSRRLMVEEEARRPAAREA